MMPKQWLRLGVLLAILAGVAWIYWKGRDDADTKNENKALRTENKAVAQSNQITRETESRVDRESVRNRAQAERDQQELDDATDSGAAGTPDDPGVRVAREAYERALRSACRVQGTSPCAAPASAP